MFFPLPRFGFPDSAISIRRRIASGRPGCYALFTLVGIAGEDDLDAPDLVAPTTPAPKTDAGKTKDRRNGGPNYQNQGQSRSRQQKVANSARTLEPNASELLRDQLIAQLKALNSAEEAAD